MAAATHAAATAGRKPRGRRPGSAGAPRRHRHHPTPTANTAGATSPSARPCVNAAAATTAPSANTWRHPGPRCATTAIRYSAAAHNGTSSASGVTRVVTSSSTGCSATAAVATVCSSRRRPNTSPASIQVSATVASSSSTP